MSDATPARKEKHMEDLDALEGKAKEKHVDLLELLNSLDLENDPNMEELNTRYGREKMEKGFF